MLVCLAQLGIVIMLFDVSGETKLLDLPAAALASGMSSARFAGRGFLLRGRFSLALSDQAAGRGLLISEVQTRSAPAERAIASASARDNVPSFSP